MKRSVYSKSSKIGLAHYSAQMLSHVLIFTAHNMHAHKMSTLVEVLRWKAGGSCLLHGLVAAHSDLLCCLALIPATIRCITHQVYTIQSAV